VNHPFYEVAANAERLVEAGHHVYQKFTCVGCGSRQTMAERDKFFTSGECEECHAVTDIVASGCNFLLHMSVVHEDDRDQAHDDGQTHDDDDGREKQDDGHRP
jgi:hypothetical protein